MERSSGEFYAVRAEGVISPPVFKEGWREAPGWLLFRYRCSMEVALATVAFDTRVPERALVNRRAMTFRASVVNALLEVAHDARRMRRVTGGSFVDTACCVAALHS